MEHAEETAYGQPDFHINRGSFKASNHALLKETPYARTAATSDSTVLEEFWRTFQERIQSPLATYQWFSVSASTFAPNDPIKAYMATAIDKSRAVAALIISRHFGAPLYHPPSEWLGEPFDVPHTGEAALQSVIEQLIRAKKPIRLSRLYADSPAVHLLQELASKRGCLQMFDDGQVPIIILDKTRDEPDHRLNSGRRSDLRRARRRAEKIGEVEITVESPAEAEADDMLQAAYAVEGSGWKNREGSSILTNKKYASFFNAYCRQAASQGQLRIAFLRVGGRIAATQIAIERGGEFWVLKIGYDPEFSSCSPGILLMHEVIAYAASRKLDRLEMLGTMEPWISIWKPFIRNTVTIYFYPYTISGFTMRTLFWFKPHVQQSYRRIIKSVVSCILPKFIVGNNISDAITVANRIVSKGHTTSIGYWSNMNDHPQKANDEYTRAITSLRTESSHVRHLSIKLPSIRFSEDLLRNIAKLAIESNITLHCDSHGPEDVNKTQNIIAKFKSEGMELGYTIPARWRRSVADAGWARSRGLSVRVVKGQWPDSEADPIDLRTAYLNVIDELARGGIRHVAIASHDTPLVKEAVQRLRAANVTCHLELLYGLPARRSLVQAEELGLEVRFYLPYGMSYLPYSIKKSLRQPRLLWWLARGWVGLA